MQNLIGGRYRTTERLGAGGMGTVYAAIDTVTGARVAVKVVSADVAESDVLLSRFEREVRAVRALETPHVVRTFDAARDSASGLPFYVMEVLEGDDVAFVLKRLGPLRPDLVLRIGAQACAGLEAAHAARIVHRDIKPSNLFLAAGPTPGERVVKMLDFGIAKLAHEPDAQERPKDVTNLTKTGSLLGSPMYMAPEQARGHKNVDVRADIWSLGVVLYQALTGRTPHPYTDAIGDLIIAICTEPAERIELLAPWVPKHVADIVHRALAIQPAARYQSIGEMRAALLACLSGNARIHESMLVTIPESERIASPPSVGIAQGTMTAVLPPDVMASGMPSPNATPKRPNIGVLIAAVFVVALCGGLLSFLLFRKNEPVESSEQPESISSANTNTVPVTEPEASATVASAPSASAQPLKKAIAAPRGTQQKSKPARSGDIYLGR